MFAYRLCLALGWPDPDVLLEWLTLRQLMEWQEYYGLEPFGFPAADILHARLMWAALRATSTEKWKGMPKDFLMRPDEPREGGAAEEVVEVDPVKWLKEHLPGKPEGEE